MTTVWPARTRRGPPCPPGGSHLGISTRPEATVDVEMLAPRPEGNQRALSVLLEVFEPVDARWRGLGQIPDSGLRLRAPYAEFDVESRLGIQRIPADPHPACRCGDILRGILAPPKCPAFGRTCTPDHPLGPCMVSTRSVRSGNAGRLTDYVRGHCCP